MVSYIILLSKDMKGPRRVLSRPLRPIETPVNGLVLFENVKNSKNRISMEYIKKSSFYRTDFSSFVY